MDFAALHQQTTPLLLANVWDAASVQAAEQTGYDALGTSSAAIAAMFGYSDGEGISFTELRQWVVRLRALSKLPLSVDMEAGYGENPEQMIANLVELAELGIVGVNLEDSVVRHGERTLLDAPAFAAGLKAIRVGLVKERISLFINARTDTFLLGVSDALAQTVARGRLYAESGADGFFVPCVTQEADIAAIVKAVPLPINVMCMPDLPAFEVLAGLGVKRISMGNFVHSEIQRYLQGMLQDIRARQSFQVIFSHENNR